jgi:DUF1680 family protein
MKTNQKRTPRLQAAQWLPFGTIKPSGWLRAQMAQDLEHGFVGHLDELVPGLIQRDDIYGADRLTRATKTKDLGVVAKEIQWEVQFLWWNSETQSNWLDGMARAALLLDQPEFIAKARARIDHLLATQDADGYLGIYAPDLRYNFSGENGELWAQASLFRVLLGWHEATQDQCAIAAVRRAVEVTMAAYPIGQSHPFDVQNDFAGVGHGLVFTDILDRLDQLTGDERYLDYARWLYAEYSRQPLSQDDIQLTHLLDPEYPFKAHGVHTYEQIRSLLTAVYSGDNPQVDAALAAALTKLETCLTPSGGPIGDEFIAGRKADASETGYEYCSIHELLDTYTHLLQKTGDMQWADRAEWLFFNAAQGARHPSETSKVPPVCGGIAYLKTDNSLSMTGPLHPDDPQDTKIPQIRYKYSPVHQDVAVCCVPNAGRIAPYFAKAMWLRSADGLVAALYGASELRAEINGVNVKIAQETDYPFDPSLTFSLETAQPTEFTLSFRIPAWTTGFSLSDESFTVHDNLIHIRKTWQTGDTVTLRFENEIKIQSWQDENIVTYGPLLFCLPLDGEFSPGQEYAPGFRDASYTLTDPSALNLRLAPQAAFTLEHHPFDLSHPFDSLSLTGNLLTSSGIPYPAQLIPLGASLLRRVTFQQG